MRQIGKKQLDEACKGAIDGCYDKLLEHDGHQVAVTFNGNTGNCDIYCEECSDTIESADAESLGKHCGCEVDVIAYTDRMTVECLDHNEILVVAMPE